MTVAYDALGRRVAKTTNGVTTWFTYDGDQVIMDRSGSAPHGVLAEYGFDGADLFAVRTPTDTLVAVRALMNGTVTGLLRANGGAEVKRYDLMVRPFGQQVADTGLLLRYKMGSQEYDQETGLYHLGARYYDPQLHRFLSEDPSGIAGGLNLYAYSGNDPVNHRDPSGLDECYYELHQPYTIWSDGTVTWWAPYLAGPFGDCGGGGGPGAGPGGGSGGSGDPTGTGHLCQESTLVGSITVDQSIAFSALWFINSAVDAGAQFTITSDFRTTAHQKDLMDRRNATYAASWLGLNLPAHPQWNPVARPGSSAHEGGLAFDVAADPASLAVLNQLAAAFGFMPLAGDVGHYQSLGNGSYASRLDAIQANQAGYDPSNVPACGGPVTGVIIP